MSTETTTEHQWENPREVSFERALQVVMSLDSDLRLDREAEIFTLVSAPSTSLYRSATELSLFDRELRRAAARMEELTDPDDPRPAPLSTGRLEIVDASAGSLEVLVVGIGVVQHVLLSDPMRAILTAASAAGHALKVVGWVRSKLAPNDPLAKISIRTTIDALKGLVEIDALRKQLGMPAVDMVVAPPQGATPRTSEPEVVQMLRAVTDSQSAPPPGMRRITHIRREPDGTLSVVVIEEAA